MKKMDALVKARPNFSSQMQEVEAILREDGEFTEQVITQELNWFYNKLDLDDYYFQTTSSSQIARHIQSLYAAKILSRSGGKDVGLQLISENDEFGAMYACRSVHAEAVKIERRIQERYPDYRLQSYRTSAADDRGTRLRLYFLSPPDFVNPYTDPQETDLEKIGSKIFLKVTPESTIQRYQSLLNLAVDRLGPVIDASDKPSTNEKRLMIAFRRNSTHSYFSAISDLLNYYGLHSNRKYIEHFSNGIVIFSIYVHNEFDKETFESLMNSLPTLGTSGLRKMVVDMTINNIREETSLTYVLPRTSLTPLFQQNKLSAQEVSYAYAGWKFAHLFLNRSTEEYALLSSVLQKDPMYMSLLGRLRTSLQRATFTEGRVLDGIINNPELIKELYEDFTRYHFRDNAQEVMPYDRHHNEALEQKIKKAAANEEDQQILSAFLKFNRHILKTNFYKDSKVALAFRLDPAFLAGSEYPELPFGIFFIVGSEFRGFHVRFRDVARGGIRIVRSSNPQVFSHNANTIFDENYGLAYTQQKKNKDIPEGGSKGTILLSLEHQDKAEIAFKKYIDSLLDLMMPNDKMVDHYGNKELLFLGPDEGTAELMDWASLHARKRGYPFWKAFTTGKSIQYGGIPHDLYGMTTRSVHQYVLGILEKEELNEHEVTKVQTGGPDGDLGSNEIKISADITTSVVDGSGVLYDPEGLDRQELTRLANARLMVENFNRNKISPHGFLVRVSDNDIHLPDGTVVDSGLRFRNEFHLSNYAAADFFVPCGGRPEAVNSNNVHRLFDESGKPKFKYIVEGANLFITEEARLKLEEAGVIIYKDASANKGGVTSSSKEVLAALAFDDEEFAEHMQIKDGQVPAFYRAYVEEVQQQIEENARLEFDAIWNENEKTEEARTLITNRLSEKINELNDLIQNSSLWDNDSLRQTILAEACPQTLQEQLGLETILARVPDNYIRAIFGAHLASRYVYQFGLSAPEFAFFEFIQRYIGQFSRD
ncbi:MAG: NAD-glutamate dehydrogenase [Myxococcales bacterium]|nr:NAD-glutamate dehydrogenase [Myxococcales bacterium]